MQSSHIDHAVADVAATVPRQSGLFARRNFRLLWLGESISLVGDQFHLVALTWLTLEITESAAILGNVLAVAMAARATCLLLGGVIVDRVTPQRVMVIINGLRAILGVVLTAFVLLDVLAVWHLYMFAFTFGLLDAFFQPAFLTIPPLLATTTELSRANAILQATRRACEMLGPLLAGVLLKVSGAGAAFGADAVSFALAAALFCMIRIDDRSLPTVTHPRPRFSRMSEQWQQVLVELRDGLGHVVGDRVLRILVMAVAVVNLLIAGPLAVGLPTLARTRFVADPLAFGLLLSAFGGGALLGTLLAGVVRRTVQWWRWIIGTFGVFGVCFLGISYASSAWMAAVAVALAGTGAGFVLILIFTQFQQTSAPESRGRTMSVLVCASLTCAALSNALAGMVAQRDVTLLFGATGALLLWSMAGFGLYRLVYSRG